MSVHPLHYKCIDVPRPGAQLVGASSCSVKGRSFDPPPGHIPQLQVRSPVRACTGGNQSTFLSLSLFLSLSPSSSPSLPTSLPFLSLKSVTYPWVKIIFKCTKKIRSFSQRLTTEMLPPLHSCSSQCPATALARALWWDLLRAPI